MLAWQQKESHPDALWECSAVSSLCSAVANARTGILKVDVPECVY